MHSPETISPGSLSFSWPTNNGSQCFLFRALTLCFFFFPSPLFLGNLWDVTDRDIDRYTEALLQGWLGAGPGAPLLHYVSQARQAPRLKYLIGAAPVAYGLPVSLQTS